MFNIIRSQKHLQSFVMILLGTLLGVGIGLSLMGMAPGQESEPAQPQARRLEQVSWDAVDHVMRIVVSRGTTGGTGKYKPDKLLEDYELRYDFEENVGAPTMRFKEEVRKFSVSEAVKVHEIMGKISDYAVASVNWWEEGKGEPLDKKKLRGGSRPEEHKAGDVRPCRVSDGYLAQAVEGRGSSRE